MSTNILLKQHDLLPVVALTLLDDATAVDLTSADEARLLITSARGVLVLDEVMVIDPDQTTNTGHVSYAWQAGDTDVAGTYHAEVQVMWPGDRPQTFPASGYLSLIIKPDLGPASITSA